MSSEQQHPPYPPASQGVKTVRPAGVAVKGMPPHTPGVKMPGMKVPRPMGMPHQTGGIRGGSYPVSTPSPSVPIPPVNEFVTPPSIPESKETDFFPPVPSVNTAEINVDDVWGGEKNIFTDDLASASFGKEKRRTDADENTDSEYSSDLMDDLYYEQNPYEKNMASDLGLPPAFIKTKVLVPLFVFFLFCGGLFGYFTAALNNNSSSELPGVVYNAEIPKGRPRCGIAQKGQGCVLYLMNAQRREMEAKEFFNMASDMLNIPKFQIETSNIRYATMRIPPGYIALINVPPL